MTRVLYVGTMYNIHYTLLCSKLLYRTMYNIQVFIVDVIIIIYRYISRPVTSHSTCLCSYPILTALQNYANFTVTMVTVLPWQIHIFVNL